MALQTSTQVDFRLINFCDLQNSAVAADLFEQHYQEVALDKNLLKLDANWDSYKIMESSGRLMAIGAFSGELLIGYSVNIVMQALHYAKLLFCQNDLLFVAREYRNGVGRKLIQHTEKLARERGVHLMLWHAKQATTLDRLLPRLGYNVQDIIYSKKL